MTLSVGRARAAVAVPAGSGAVDFTLAKGDGTAVAATGARASRLNSAAMLLVERAGIGPPVGSDSGWVVKLNRVPSESVG